MAPLPPPARAGERGFSLVEVLVALFIMAIAVFPLMEVMQRSEMAAFDAKFTTLACGKIRRILSGITRTAVPGDEGFGNLEDLTEEDGFDARFAFADVYYDYKVEAVDLSADILTAGDEETDEEADPFVKDSDQEAAIDARYRARYVRISMYYHLSGGQEKEVVVETLIPPLPRDEEGDAGSGVSDSVSPNTGSGS